jgi:acyl-lipid omega-6 desaturase (Delta-12 desaturase)
MENPNQEVLSRLPQVVKTYQIPNTKKAVLQIFSSFAPFLVIWVLMYFTFQWSLVATFGLAILNAFFLVRIFIIQHDCGHQSFTKYRWLNDALGFVASFISLIPYKYWARSHNFHHGHNGKLWEHRDIGDVETLTVEEFEKKSRLQRFGYRIYRSAPVMFGLVPIYYMFLHHRIPTIKMKGWEKVNKSLIINNLWIVGFFTLLILWLGWKAILVIHLPIVVVFGTIAIWFFYVQHQHETAYKEWTEKWDYLTAAIKGSTYYKLPRLFHWLTGNIGYHHIHHLNPLVPNYNLAKCHKENPILDELANKITFMESLSCVFNHLWDEQAQKMISFREYYKRNNQTWFAI